MRLFRLLFLLAALALVGLQPGYAQYATWSRPLAPAAVTAMSVTDQAGNTYVAGIYRGSLTMGATTLPAPVGVSPYDAYLTKINASGLVQWAIAGTGIKYETVQGLTLDPSGNVYLAVNTGVDSIAGISHSFTFGGRTLSQAGTMLAKVNPAGTVSSLTYLHQGNTAAKVTALAADATGSCYLSVASYSIWTFGPYAFAGAGSYSSVILRADAAGTVSLVQALAPTLAGQSYLRVEDLKLGPAGDLYCTGTLDGVATLGSSPAIVLQGRGGFVARYSAAGVAQWALISSTSGSGGGAANRSLAVGAAGEVYVAGTAGASDVSFGGLPLGSRGDYLIKVSAAGVTQWVRATDTNDGTRVDSQQHADQVVVDGAGNVYRLGVFNNSLVQFSSNISINHPDATAGRNLVDAFYLVSYDAAGTPRWATVADNELAHSLSGPFHNYHQGAGLGCDAGGNLYLLGYLFTRGNTPGQLIFNGHVLSNGYTLLRLSPAGRISGTIYVDQNNNGSRDAGEPPFPYPQIVSDLSQSHTYSSAPLTGEYSFFGLPGTPFGVTVSSPHPYYTLSAPVTRTGTFPAVGQTLGGQDFGLVAIPNQTDVRVSLTPNGPMRPGFASRYRLTLENVGTTVVSGSASITLDGRLIYVGSMPNGSAAGQTVTWNYSSLAPFAQQDYDVMFILPITVTLGTVITTSATAPLTADVAPANNTASLVQTAVSSYDPNAIEVNYEQLSPAQVASQQPLDYTIRFQNLGTDQAFTVVLSDTLDFHQLDLSTLQLISQSHPGQWNLSGEGLLTVRFLNINLPQSSLNEPASHGFVRFRVLPKTTLVVGDLVHNKADIFFDYNAPVRTNTATTAVLLPTAMTADSRTTAFTAYPNPAHESLSVAAVLSKAGTLRLSLLDVLGRPVAQQTIAAPTGPLQHTFALRGLAPGLYLLRVQRPDGTTATQRVVVE
jgi:uncharacterized repeat protein (TIGR01451 family)